MSSFTKEGIKAGMGNSMNIRMNATADSMAVTVSLWVRFRLAETELVWESDADIKIHSFVVLKTPWML